MERKRTEILGICFFLHTYADDFRFEVLAAEDSVGWCEKLGRVKVFRTREIALQKFETLDAIEGVHLRTFLVECAIEFVADTEDVPALLENLEAQR